MAKKKPPERVQIGEQIVDLTNLDKVYWPDDGYTKGDMIAFYRDLVPFLLPYLVDRPLTLKRYPNGIAGKHFFQKDFDHAPAWVRRLPLQAETGENAARGEPVDYLLCQDEATLAWAANTGAIEFHPWNSRAGRLDYPDYAALDLDPVEIPFEEVIRVARLIHDLLAEIGAQSFIKTSGKRGLHVFVPLGAQYPYEAALEFAGLLVQAAHARLPDMTSLERSPKKRAGKVYLDHLQNTWGHHVIAPYSLRPTPQATLSTPLAWEEVQPDLAPQAFNLKTIRKRLEKTGDLWKGVLGPGIDLPACMDALQQERAP